jgi:hypothetical protein
MVTAATKVDITGENPAPCDASISTTAETIGQRW